MTTSDTESLHPCARCARMQKTCCQSTDVLLTRGDVGRIEAHTQQRGFWTRRAPDDPTYNEPDPDDPNWLRYTFDDAGRRRLLNRQANGDCTFSGEQGCVLPGEVRPLICRLYPAAYTERALQGVGENRCPTALLPASNPKVSMLTVLDMKDVDMERWRRALYEELREELREGQGDDP